MRPILTVFNAVFSAASETGTTYHRLPDQNAQYPFIHVHRSNVVHENTKAEERGALYQSVSLWGLENQRLQLDTINEALHRQLKRIRQYGDYYLRVRNINEEVIHDNTTGSFLLHYHMTIEFTFNKRS